MRQAELDRSSRCGIESEETREPIRAGLLQLALNSGVTRYAFPDEAAGKG